MANEEPKVKIADGTEKVELGRGDEALAKLADMVEANTRMQLEINRLSREFNQRDLDMADHLDRAIKRGYLKAGSYRTHHGVVVIFQGSHPCGYSVMLMPELTPVNPPKGPDLPF